MTKLSLLLALIVVLGCIGYFGARAGYDVHGINVTINQQESETDRYVLFYQDTGDGDQAYYIHYYWQNFAQPDSAGNTGEWRMGDIFTQDQYDALGKVGLNDIVAYLFNLATSRIDDVPGWMSLAFDIMTVAFLAIVFLFVRGN